MKVSLLIPYNPSSKHWEQLFYRTQEEWVAQRAAADDMDIELCVGAQHGKGAMRVAECVNRAASMATGDIFALWGADHWPDVPRLRWVVEQFEAGAAWQPMFQHTAIIDRDSTLRILDGEDARSDNVTWSDSVPMCMGIFAVRRDVFEDVGGEDERFVGWGMEDVALREALDTLHGTPGPPEYGSVLLSLWHPIQSHNDLNAQRNVEIYNNEYIAAGGDEAKMRQVLARAAAWAEEQR
jgi:N-terminal domain of galactosyltransferase